VRKERPLLKSRAYFLPVILAFAFTLAYWGTFVSLFETWSGRPDYSHGFIVPLASIYFVYALRDRLKSVKIAPAILWGSAATFAAVLMLMLGVTGGMITLQQFSILVVLPGLIILLMGKSMLKALLLPLGYLLLMVPLVLDIVFAPLHWPFQLFGAKIAALILSLLGIPVFNTAQFIELPNTPLEVANACSGIRYLVSITALAVPLAYLTMDTWVKRAFLVFSSLLIGILANPIRIAMIGLWVYYGGSILHGPGHILQGYFVSVVGFGFLFATAWIMSRKQTDARSKEGIAQRREIRGNANAGGFDKEQPCRVIKEGKSSYKSNDDKCSGVAWTFAISIMLAAAIFVNSYKPIPVPLGAKAEQLPLVLEGWSGSVMESPAGKVVTLPGPDVEMCVAYSNSSGDIVYYQAGYYEYQRQGKEFIHYTLQKLYDRAKPIRLEIAPGRNIEARQVLLRDGGRKRLVTYWYEMDGYSISSNIEAKIITAFRGLLQWKTNGAIVLIWSDLETADSDGKAAARQRGFASAGYPSLSSYLNIH
jgi:EpsI family protein